MLQAIGILIGILIVLLGIIMIFDARILTKSFLVLVIKMRQQVD